MSSKRSSFEKGHKRKYLVVIDDTEECDRAVYWAGKRAGRTKSQIVMLRVIETGDHNQQWLGVADIMKAEAQEAANAVLDKFAARITQIARITPDRVIREGDTAEQIVKLIEEDADIGILVLAVGIWLWRWFYREAALDSTARRVAKNSLLPIGLQLVGRWWDEGTVLRAAHAYQQATDWHKRTPTP